MGYSRNPETHGDHVFMEIRSVLTPYAVIIDGQTWREEGRQYIRQHSPERSSASVESGTNEEEQCCKKWGGISAILVQQGETMHNTSSYRDRRTT